MSGSLTWHCFCHFQPVKPGNGRFKGGKFLKNLPFWFPKKENAFWYLVFILLFSFSLDFWGWNKSRPVIFGLPLWIYYFLILTLLTSVVFYIFSKYFWRIKQ
jgi:hypothetical protein